MTARIEAIGIETRLPGFELRVDHLSVDEGQIISVLGPSGSGKSTLLRIVALLEKPDSGTVMVDGTKARFRDLKIRRTIAMMLQSPAMLRGTVLRNLRLPLEWRGIDHSSVLERARDALAQVGLEGFEQRDASKISGGEKQRVALARILCIEPKVALLDEPLSHIDDDLKNRLGEVIQDLAQARGTSVIWVTHDRSEASRFADTAVHLNSGTLTSPTSASTT